MNSPKKKKSLLKLINEFIKVAGYGMNIQKLVVFLYTSNEKPEKEIKIISFTLA